MLLLLILKHKLLVFLFFLVVLEFEFDFGLFGEGFEQVLINNDVSHIALFKNDTVESEFAVELLHHGDGHVGFQVENLAEPHTVNEISNILFNLSRKKLVKSSSS